MGGVSPSNRSPPLFANNKPVPFPSLSLQNGVIGSSDKDTSPAAVTSRVTTSFEVTIDYSRLEGSGNRNRGPPAAEELPPMRTPRREDRKIATAGFSSSSSSAEEPRTRQSRGNGTSVSNSESFLVSV